MKLVIASDHAGFQLKQQLLPRLQAEHEVEDLGSFSEDSVDYPDFGALVGKAVVAGRAERGLLICGTGIGIAIAANKVPGVRASVVHDTVSAQAAVEHNDLNVLALGGRIVGPELAFEIVTTYLNARFAGGRHQRRLDKIAELEHKALKCS